MNENEPQAAAAPSRQIVIDPQEQELDNLYLSLKRVWKTRRRQLKEIEKLDAEYEKLMRKFKHFNNPIAANNLE